MRQSGAQDKRQGLWLLWLVWLVYLAMAQNSAAPHVEPRSPYKAKLFLGLANYLRH